jgi:hypothetical protein
MFRIEEEAKRETCVKQAEPEDRTLLGIYYFVTDVELLAHYCS